MTFVRTLTGFSPPRRYDGLPFTLAGIQESDAPTAAWATLETRALSPVDGDPTNPLSRNFTTALATLETGWYRILWTDGTGATFPSDPVQFPGGAAPITPPPQFGLERILRAAPATISGPFYDIDGAIIDPGIVTVTITRADGGIVVVDAATTGTGATARSFELSAINTALLDTLTAVWTSSTLGVISTQTEVVGGFLFSITQARNRDPLADTTIYPTSKLLDARTFAEQELEDACGAAFVPRYVLESAQAHDGRPPRLPTRTRAIRSLSIDGVAQPDSFIASLRFDNGWLTPAHYWDRRPYGRIVIGYEHGYSTPPAGATRAALDLARAVLIADNSDSAIDPRTTRIITADGELRLDGTSGRFGLPSVDRFVNSQRQIRLA